MKMSTCLVLALRILPSAPLAFKENNYGGLPPCPPRMGCRPTNPAIFIPRWWPRGMNDWYENEHLPPLALRILPSAPLAFKKKKYGGLPPYPLRMGCRPYEPCYFHPKVAATGHERLLRCARNDQWENRSVQGPVVSRFGSG
jgi:hypothetical protein